jgi:uncharacterized membrane protein YbhN (UPF0104 family)
LVTELNRERTKIYNRIWFFIVAFGLAAWLKSHYQSLFSFYDNLSVWILFSFLTLTLLAKIFVYVNFVACLRSLNISLPFHQGLSAFGIIQISRYAPFGFGHHLARYRIFHEKGTPNVKILKSTAYEHLTLLSSSIVLILVLLPVLISRSDTSDQLLLLLSEVNIDWVPIYLGCIAVGLYVVKYGYNLFRKFELNSIISFRSRIAGHILMLTPHWVLMGVSFGLIFSQFQSLTPSFWLYLIFLYTVSWLTGFMAFFAPAGIGVREAVLVLGLSSILDLDMALSISLIHRALLFMVDVIFFMVTRLLVHIRNSRDEGNGVEN